MAINVLLFSIRISGLTRDSGRRITTRARKLTLYSRVNESVELIDIVKINAVKNINAVP